MIHHLSTIERRIEAIREILRLLRSKKGTVDSKNRPESYVYVDDSSDNYNDIASGGIALFYVWAVEQKNSRRGWDEGHEQDVMVPWVMKRKITDGEAISHEENGNINVKTSQSEATQREKGKGYKPDQQEKIASNVEVTFQRYYHLYRKGELEANIEAAGGRVLHSGYEKDNWWALARAT